MTTWTISAAYRVPLPEPGQLAALAEQLQEHDATVRLEHGQVHVALTEAGTDLLDAGAHAVQALHAAGLHLQDLSQIEVVDEQEAQRRAAAG